jgi:hypothetical protein
MSRIVIVKLIYHRHKPIDLLHVKWLILAISNSLEEFDVLGAIAIKFPVSWVFDVLSFAMCLHTFLRNVSFIFKVDQEESLNYEIARLQIQKDRKSYNILTPTEARTIFLVVENDQPFYRLQGYA